MKVVWILGAGFSKPLDGPLMGELFGRRLSDNIKARRSTRGFTAARFADAHNAYAPMDNYGDRFPNATLPWRNAEEFIDMLERYATAPNPPPFLEQIFSSHSAPLGVAKETSKSVRAYLAAATHWFIPDQSEIDNSERWAPYREWKRHVHAGDTIITFNYDVVAESVLKHGVFVPLPVKGEHMEDGAKLATLLKLHGSVSWVRKDQDVEETRDPLLAIEEEREFVLGLPGPSKAEFASSAHFAHLWAAAEKALTEADVVVLIGYRFAETDHVAKTRLLSALAKNQQPGLTVRIVLGNGGDDVRRIEGLFQWALSRRGFITPAEVRSWKQTPPHRRERPTGVVVESVPLWSQDFLSVARRDNLWAWEGHGLEVQP